MCHLRPAIGEWWDYNLGTLSLGSGRCGPWKVRRGRTIYQCLALWVRGGGPGGAISMRSNITPTTDRDFCGNWTAWLMAHGVLVAKPAERPAARWCRRYRGLLWWLRVEPSGPMPSITEGRGRCHDGFVHMYFYIWLNIDILNAMCFVSHAKCTFDALMFEAVKETYPGQIGNTTIWNSKEEQAAYSRHSCKAVTEHMCT